MYLVNVNNSMHEVHNKMNNYNLVDVTDMSRNYPSLLTPPMDSPDSTVMLSSSASNSPNYENTYIVQGLNIKPMAISTTEDNGPYLKIIEQPVERFRFRYRSEMAGTHGSLNGRNSNKARKQTYPTVKLCSYGQSAIIRCSLYQYSREDMMHTRQPHAHRLVRKQGPDEIDDPHDFHVTEANDFTATFHSMGIIHTAKKHIVAELERKQRTLKLEEVARLDNCCRLLTKKEEQEVRLAVEKDSKSINLNIVCLRFDAFEVMDDIYYPICPPIYSASINNLKSALTGDLKIVRMDNFSSPSRGGKEVFILVEKVTKKNIKVRFFELDDHGNEIWSDIGKFTELDVHHQYAIVFRTPPYKDLDIDREVKVFVELYRPTDGARSDAKDFSYMPSKVAKNRKRPRTSNHSYSSSDISSNDLPLTIANLPNPNEFNTNYQKPDTLVVNSDELEEALQQGDINSAEFQTVLETLLNSGMGSLYVNDLTSDDLKSLQIDAPCKSEKRSMGESSPPNRALRKLTTEEQKKVNKFQEELVAFVRTNPPSKRMSMMLTNLFENPEFITVNNMETVLHLLISENNQTFLPFLLKLLFKYQQVDLINLRNKKGQTALHLAVKSNNYLAVHHLLYTRADITIQDLQGNTAFHVAVTENMPIAILKLLCMNHDVSSCIDAVNYDGCTALHLAVKSNNLHATKLLCWKKADVNAEDKKTGNTVLHMAILDQNPELVKFLLENTEADLDSENYAQYSPMKLIKTLIKKEEKYPALMQIHEFIENHMKEKGICIEVTIKEESDMSEDDESQSVISPEEIILKYEPDYLKDKYSEINKMTDKCLNQVSTLLDKSGAWHSLAELFNYDYLIKSNMFASSKSFLEFVLKQGESIYVIRNFLEDLDEMEAVQCLDNMVLEMNP